VWTRRGSEQHQHVAGARMLGALHGDLTKRGIVMRVVEAHAKVRDLLRAEGLEERVGYLGRHLFAEQAIAEFHGAEKDTHSCEKITAPAWAR
jgi:hypothetical protein